MSHHPNQSKGLAQQSRPMAQDLQRHTPRAAASHLSPAELTKRDAGAVDEDAAALERVQATRLNKPPHLHVFFEGACKVCGIKQPRTEAFDQIETNDPEAFRFALTLDSEKDIALRDTKPGAVVECGYDDGSKATAVFVRREVDRDLAWYVCEAAPTLTMRALKPPGRR